MHGRVSYRRTEPIISRGWAEVLALTVLFVILGVVGLVGLDEIAERGERAECLAWQTQARSNPDFYLVGWQADQCRAVGVLMEGIPVRR